MRIPHLTPVLCSACFGQYPEKAHIDFEASWDGPVINNDGTPYNVDDLVICETCLRDAVAMLPADAEEQAKDERIADLSARYEEAMEFAMRLQTGITALQDALEAKLEPVAPAPKRRTPAKA